MAIIREESAMHRQVAIMLVTPLVWGFFIIYEGEAHEEFTWKEFAGMFLVIVATISYLVAERDAKQEEDDPSKDQNGWKDLEEESKEHLLKEENIASDDEVFASFNDKRHEVNRIKFDSLATREEAGRT